MTTVGQDLKFVNGRIYVDVNTVVKGAIVSSSLQDVTASVAQAIAPYIRQINGCQ